MANHNELQEKVEKKYRQKEKRKTGKMKVSGKKIFELKKIITKK